MKTILFSIPYGMSARNFMRSDVFRILREKVHLIVVSSLAADPVFREEFQHPNVEFVDVPRIRWLPLQIVRQILYPIDATQFTRRNPVSTLITLRNQLRRENPGRYFMYRFLTETLGQIPGAVSLLRALHSRFLKNDAVIKLFDEEKIDLVFLTHGYVQEEEELALEASRKGIPVVNMIHSWDNLTTKSGMRTFTSVNVGRLWIRDLVDRAVVWNEILADELVTLYGYPREKIFVSGIPQFDNYADPTKMQARGEFFRSIEGDPQKALVLYVAASPTMFHDQSVVIRDLVQAIQSGKLARSAQLLIRFHPWSEMQDWIDKYKGPNVLFHRPSAAFVALPVKNGWIKDQTSANELANQIYHSDVVINGFSTTSIDAAAFDKPVICYGYDGDASNQPMIDAYYRVTHYEKLLALDGIRVARNGEDLIQNLNEYLKEPKRDSEGRARIREKECYRVDGQSGKRIAEYLLSIVSKERK